MNNVFYSEFFLNWQKGIYTDIFKNKQWIQNVTGEITQIFKYEVDLANQFYQK